MPEVFNRIKRTFIRDTAKGLGRGTHRLMGSDCDVVKLESPNETITVIIVGQDAQKYICTTSTDPNRDTMDFVPLRMHPRD